MIPSFLFLIHLATHTLAPPPINFKREVVTVDGESYIINFDEARGRLEMQKNVHRILIKNAKKPYDLMGSFLFSMEYKIIIGIVLISISICLIRYFLR